MTTRDSSTSPSRIVHISATYEVEGGTSASGDVDIAGLSLDQIVTLADRLHRGLSLCHECGREVSDISVGEMTSFEFDGFVYEKVNGHWQKSDN